MSYPSRPKVFIDFKTLTPRQLEDLSQRWEKDAFQFETKLDRLLQNVSFEKLRVDITEETQMKIDKLWKTGKSLWNRLAILETWRIRNKHRKVTRASLPLK